MYLLDSVSPRERVKIGGALAKLAMLLKGQLKALERLRLAREAVALLDKLGVSAGTPPATVTLPYGDKEAARASLEAYLASGLHELPSALVPFEAHNLANMASYLGASEAATQAAAIARQAVKEPGARDALYEAAYNEYAGRGVITGVHSEAVAGQINDALARMQKSPMADPEYMRLYEAIKARNANFKEESAALLEEHRRLLREHDGSEASKALIAKIIEQRQAHEDRYRADYDEMKAQWDAYGTTLEDYKRQARDQVASEGEHVLDAIRAASPVTQAQAESWAASQVIEKAAADAMSRAGYAREAFLADMADYYRLTGGKVSAVTFIFSDARAHAENIESLAGEKRINVGARFDRKTLFHELSHLIESDPIAMAAANGFLVKRRESTTRYTINSLMNTDQFNADEIAYKDSFLHPYIGKIYPGGLTEVFSMGIEMLATPTDAAKLAALDPEMFALVSGYLTSELTPVMQARRDYQEEHVKALREKAAEEAKEAARLEKQIAKDIKYVAAEVTLDKTDWWDVMQEDYGSITYYLKRTVLGEKSRATFVGESGDYRVFSGSFRNEATKRASKGYMVLHMPFNNDSSPMRATIHDSLDMVKVLICYCRNMGLTPYNAYQALFVGDGVRNPRKSITSLAKYLRQERGENE